MRVFYVPNVLRLMSQWHGQYNISSNYYARYPHIGVLNADEISSDEIEIKGAREKGMDKCIREEEYSNTVARSSFPQVSWAKQA